MSTTPEQATAALCSAIFALGWTTSGRIVLPWDQVPDFPACFVRNIGQEQQWGANRVQGKLTLELEVWLYDRVPADGVGSAHLNCLMQKLAPAFAPDNSGLGTCTLGGLVQWARIEGKADFDPGELDQYVKAIVPVRILIP